MFERILVGVDGGEGGRDAIALAEKLRAPDGAISTARCPLLVLPRAAHADESSDPAQDNPRYGPGGSGARAPATEAPALGHLALVRASDDRGELGRARNHA
jgi:hypothetical protein